MVPWLRRWFTRRAETPEESSVAEITPDAMLVLPDAPDPLGELGRSAARREQFLLLLARQGVWFLAHGVGTAGPAKTKDELLDQIRSETESLTRSQFGQPFTFTYKGGTVFPIFSTADMAQEFVKIMPHRHPTPFQVLHSTIRLLLDNEFAGARIVMNPRSPRETEINASDITRLRFIAPV